MKENRSQSSFLFVFSCNFILLWCKIIPKPYEYYFGLMNERKKKKLKEKYPKRVKCYFCDNIKYNWLKSLLLNNNKTNKKKQQIFPLQWL